VFFVFLYEFEFSGSCFFTMKYSILAVFLFALSFELTGRTKHVLLVARAHALPDTICQGQYSQLSVTTEGGSGPFTYLWHPAATLSDPNISDPVATPLVNTMYYIEVTDQSLSVSADSIMVYVETIPLPPSPIAGPAQVCADSVCHYSVNQVIEAKSYSWTVPSEAIIQSGQNTPEILLKWGNKPGTVSVIIGNACGTSVPSVLSVSLTGIPVASTGIIGPSHLCQSDTGHYHTDTIPYALTYIWNIPGDAKILDGAGTNSVTVKLGISAGEISVYGENTCGTGPPVSMQVALDSLPASAGTITGTDTVCKGTGNYNYFISPVSFANSYGWTLPQGAVISSGQQTNRIIVEFGTNAVSGPLTAFGINSCGNGQASIKQIFIKNCSGIKENKFGSEITITPNPVSGKFYVHSKGSEDHYELYILDQLGEVLYHSHSEWSGTASTLEIDASAFPRGMMFLKVFNENGFFTTKFIVH
jgi:hypothetical protein